MYEISKVFKAYDILYFKNNALFAQSFTFQNVMKFIKYV